MFRYFFDILLIVVVLFSSAAVSQDAVDNLAKQTATARQAASILDLSTFPLVNPIQTPNARVIASQGYSAKGKVLDVANTIKAELIRRGFKELDGASFTDAYVSGTYTRDGYLVSLSAFPGTDPETVSVALGNQGNLDLKKVPVPAKATQLYAFPGTVAYLTDLSVEEANQECRRLLFQQGWQPFGETTASFFVKSNAIRLQVSISESPAQGGKTAIQLTSDLMSVDLPAPPDTTFLQYSDSTGGMLFDSRKSQAELVQFFKESLGKDKWVPTTDQPIRIDFRDHLIFRNPEKAMLELQFYDVEGKTRVDLEYKTPAQFAEEEKAADIKIAEMKREREAYSERKKNPPKVSISSPSNSRVSQKQPTSIEFATRSGTAKAAVATWLSAQEATGWSKTVNVDTKEAGNYTLKKGPVTLDVLFIDPGFIPGSITISISGDYQLQLTE